jgi:hypothetical protein
MKFKNIKSIKACSTDPFQMADKGTPLEDRGHQQMVNSSTSSTMVAMRDLDVEIHVY